MSEDVEFRLLEIDDLGEILELERLLFGADAWPRSSFEGELFQPQTREYFVGVAGGRIVAYGGIMCVPPVADIQTIGVVPEWQGRGLGRRLLGLLLEACSRRGAEDVLLEVRSDNPRAQELYARRGFERIHVRRRYYRDGADAHIMKLDLTPTTPTESETA